MDTGITWANLLSGLIGAVVGGLAAIVGGWLGGRAGAKHAARLAGDVAREVRRAERQEGALVRVRELLAAVENKTADFLRCARDKPKQAIPGNYRIDELLEKVTGEWATTQHLVYDRDLLGVYGSANFNGQAGRWRELHQRDPRAQLEEVQRVATEIWELTREVIAAIGKVA